MIEYLILGVILLAAGYYVYRRLSSPFKAAGGCGCGGCSCSGKDKCC